MSKLHKSEIVPTHFEVFHNYYKIRKELNKQQHYNFGYKKPKVNPCDKFGIPRDESEIAKIQAEIDAMDVENQMLIADTKVEIQVCLRAIIRDVVKANDIYVTSQLEKDTRRLLQDEAIGELDCILQELQNLLENIIQIDKNRFTQVALLIDKEINLIKGWRKSDNKIKIG